MSQSLILDADQWIEHGFVYHDGRIYSYETDRKEQTYMEFNGMSVEEFLKDTALPESAREWARSLSGA